MQDLISPTIADLIDDLVTFDSPERDAALRELGSRIAATSRGERLSLVDTLVDLASDPSSAGIEPRTILKHLHAGCDTDGMPASDRDELRGQLEGSARELCLLTLAANANMAQSVALSGRKPRTVSVTVAQIALRACIAEDERSRIETLFATPALA